MEHKGTVYFFTGLSGAGKTTVGSLFYQRLKNTKPNAVYLDGDEIRVAFGEDVGYTNDERLRWAGRIFRVCRLLSDQGIDVVCCSIAMFDTVRIVQTGCHTTELPVTLIFITDHRIQGVYHLISHHSRKSAQSIIK